MVSRDEKKSPHTKAVGLVHAEDRVEGRKGKRRSENGEAHAGAAPGVGAQGGKGAVGGKAGRGGTARPVTWQELDQQKLEDAAEAAELIRDMMRGKVDKSDAVPFQTRLTAAHYMVEYGERVQKRRAERDKKAGEVSVPIDDVIRALASNRRNAAERVAGDAARARRGDDD